MLANVGPGAELLSQLLCYERGITSPVTVSSDLSILAGACDLHENTKLVRMVLAILLISAGFDGNRIRPHIGHKLSPPPSQTSRFWVCRGSAPCSSALPI